MGEKSDSDSTMKLSKGVLKTIVRIVDKPQRHWVGDGLPVHGMLSYTDLGRYLNPFILLDYGAPYEFQAHFQPRGVGFHPHRGFETVTVAYQGEISHKDSHGGGGTIGTGDVQWMTAGSGIQHEEMHSQKFTDTGGTLEMLQMWVNLPAESKMTPPKYQSLIAKDIPTVNLPDHAGTLRVVAGLYAGAKGPAKTFTPLDMWDINIKAGKTLKLDIPNGWPVGILVRNGAVSIQGTALDDVALVVLNKTGTNVEIKASKDSALMFFTGEPIEETIVGHGPFVMNSKDEIQQAFRDYEDGKFGGPPM